MKSPASTCRESIRNESPEGQPFVSVADARRWTEVPSSVLFVDARARRQYQQGHLPGALNLPARELNPVEDGVRRLADREELPRRLRNPGPGVRLVVYGGRGGADAAHLWWTLRTHYAEPVWLLDGGVESWQAEGGSLEQEAVDGARHEATDRNAEDGEGRSSPGSDPADDPTMAVEPSDSTSSESLISVEELLGRLDDSSLAIVDTREPEEFSGEMNAAKRGGHIPGASLFPWTRALESDLRLRRESELREMLASALEKPEVVVYCQSGVRAAHTLAVLRKLGHPRVRLYLGSWGEWGNREDTPVEVEVVE